MTGTIDKHIGFVIDKVELYSEYQKRFRESLQQKVNKLKQEEPKLLKVFLIENRPLDFGFFMHNTLGLTKPKVFADGLVTMSPATISLQSSGLVIMNVVTAGVKNAINLRYKEFWEINPEYRDILREIVFKK